jgi:hypothetical protein
MATESECIEYARECVRLAGLTDDPDIRDRLLEIARDFAAREHQGASGTEIIVTATTPRRQWQSVAHSERSLGMNCDDAKVVRR